MRIDIFFEAFIKKQKRDAAPPTPQNSTTRCPGCASPANVRGSRWECAYCGDSGGRGKIMRA